jgi:hypothetical protein
MLPHISNDLLKIPSENGSPTNEYRISNGQIEFRSLDSHGQPFSHSAGLWRILDASDVQLHFALNTAVAHWLIERLEARSPKKARAAPMDST